MFRDRRKSVAPPAGVQAASADGSPRSQKTVYSRHSHGLEEFFRSLEGRTGLTILDLAGASQANVNFITGLGHRLYSEDWYQMLEMHFGPGDFCAAQQDPGRAQRFLNDCLGFPEACFDGALLWDALEYLASPLLTPAIERLARIIKPDGYLLAIFHADEKAQQVSVYHYRIADAATLHLLPRAQRAPAQFYNNRAIERLFSAFRSVKFFLTRDHLREVIVRR